MSFRRAALIAVALSALAGYSSASVLLIPDSGADKVWAFDPFDGSLISNNFIPNHASLNQPINAIDSGRGTILISDELNDAILEFSYSGSFIGTFANSATGIDGPFGITRYNGKIYAASNVNGNIVRFDDDGSNAINWAVGVGTPRDIVFRDNDALITESAGDDIVRYDHSGVFQNIWHNSDGVSGIDFPQQLQLESNGHVIAAGFTAPFGLYDFDASGVQTAAYTNLITSPRGIYRLGNGDLLYAGGTRVRKYDPDTLTEIDIVNQTGASFRFIELSEAPTPGTATLAALVGLAGFRRRR